MRRRPDLSLVGIALDYHPVTGNLRKKFTRRRPILSDFLRDHHSYDESWSRLRVDGRRMLGCFQLDCRSSHSRKAVLTHTRPLAAKAGSEHLLFAADIAGTVVFAVEGAMAAINGNLDLVGIAVLAFCTALGGGVIRDMLLGALPPAALRDWRYPAIPIGTALLVFFLHRQIRAIPAVAMQVLDAAGLALFAIAGTIKARLHKMNALVAILLGTITAVGGGTIRDLFLNQVPGVLRFEVYATAAFLGSAAMLAARKLRASSDTSAVIGGVLCFVVRIVSLWRHWNLPRVLNQ